MSDEEILNILSLNDYCLTEKSTLKFARALIEIASSKDAARYRYLVEQVPCNVADAVGSMGTHKDDLDEAIDSNIAMLKE